MAAVLSGSANAQDAAPLVEAPVPDAAAPELAAAPASDGTSSSGEGFQIARAGDTRMTCEALLDEINALNNEITDSQSAMSARAMDIGRDRMRGAAGASVASTAMTMGVGVAAALIPGAGLALGAVQGITRMAGQAAAAA